MSETVPVGKNQDSDLQGKIAEVVNASPKYHEQMVQAWRQAQESGERLGIVIKDDILFRIIDREAAHAGTVLDDTYAFRDMFQRLAQKKEQLSEPVLAKLIKEIQSAIDLGVDSSIIFRLIEEAKSS